MPVVVITPPGRLLPVTTARSRLAIDASIDDLTLDALIFAAVSVLDGPGGTLGRAIGVQTLEWRAPNWAPRHDVRWDDDGLLSRSGFGCRRDDPHWHHHRSIELPYPPIISVESITYLDPTNVRQTLDSSAYAIEVGGNIACVTPNFGTAWPAALHFPDSVRIRYVAGYPNPPAGLVQAILMMVRNVASLSVRDAALKAETVVGVGSQTFESSSAANAGMTTAIDMMLAPYRIPSL